MPGPRPHAAPPEAVSLRLDARRHAGRAESGKRRRAGPAGTLWPREPHARAAGAACPLWTASGRWAREGRHTRIRLRQGSDTLFASSFGIAPQAFAYPVGSEVEAALEVSIFNGAAGRWCPHTSRLPPAELGNTPSEQAAWFEAFRTGGSLDAARAAALLPARADTVSLYRRIRGGPCGRRRSAASFCGGGAAEHRQDAGQA